MSDQPTAPINRGTDPVSERVYALIFNGITKASAVVDEHWLPLSERERIAEAVFAELRAGNIEFRLGPLAVLADAVKTEADLVARMYHARALFHGEAKP